MEPNIWTADIRLTLINQLAEKMASRNVMTVTLGTHADIYDRIARIASESDHFLNNNYSHIMNGRFHDSPRLEWPVL